MGKEFREFIMRGNVVDMAVGIIGQGTASQPPYPSSRRLTPGSKVFLLNLFRYLKLGREIKTKPWIPPSSAGMTWELYAGQAQ